MIINSVNNVKSSFKDLCILFDVRQQIFDSRYFLSQFLLLPGVLGCLFFRGRQFKGQLLVVGFQLCLGLLSFLQLLFINLEYCH